jgi:hypothetical protein
MAYLSDDAVIDAAQNDDGAGFCVKCGAEAGQYCEPDAAQYPCDECGKRAVFGAEEIILRGYRVPRQTPLRDSLEWPTSFSFRGVSE